MRKITYRVDSYWERSCCVRCGKRLEIGDMVHDLDYEPHCSEECCNRTARKWAIRKAERPTCEVCGGDLGKEPPPFCSEGCEYEWHMTEKEKGGER